ncbi:MAG: hypothetical protein Q9157_001617 [Trypethelium eluteriae]
MKCFGVVASSRDTPKLVPGPQEVGSYKIQSWLREVMCSSGGPEESFEHRVADEDHTLDVNHPISYIYARRERD